MSASARASVCAIIQARMSSARLPGKVLADLNGRPMLACLLESLARCRELDGLILATSTEPSDDPVAEFCARSGVRCLRGPLDNVAGRFTQAVRQLSCQGFVRICGDSPLMDHRLVDHAVAEYRQNSPDMVTNVFPRSFPKGLSVEVLKAETFLRVEAEFSSREEREHVTAHFYQRPERYRIVNISSGGDFGGLQMSVDTADDMDRTRRLLAGLTRPLWDHTWQELAARVAAGGERPC